VGPGQHRHRHRRHGLHLLIAFLASAALAVPHVTIDAEADPRRGVVEGRITIDSTARVGLVDPLDTLPLPFDDLMLPRVFPGAVNEGAVRWGAVDEDTWWFYAILPERYEDTGHTRHGLFANGGWYPQPMLGGDVPVCEWDVTLRVLDENAVAAIGDQAGHDVIRWSGIAERASLAIVPRGHTTRIEEDGLDLVVVTQGRPRKRLLRELSTQLDAARPRTESWRGVVVEAPLRRHLARPGAGLAYVSDRAFRVTPGLERFHRVAVTRGVVQSLLFLPDPFERELAAASLTSAYQRRIAGAGARRVLGYGSWLPGVHAVLYDRRLPFVADVLEEPFPSDPLPDDLLQRLDPHAPGAAVMAQIGDAWGTPAVDAIGEALLIGLDADDAAEAAGVPPAFLEGWRARYPQQDYTIEVQTAIEGLPGVVTVNRLALPDAPEEVVVLDADGQRIALRMGPGPDEKEQAVDSARRVTLDPDGHVRQLTTLGDRWPTRWLPTFSGWLDTVNLQEGYAVASATATARRSGDTHHIWLGYLYTERQTLLGAQLAWAYKFGPLVDGLSRRHRLTVAAGPALLDPRFAPTDDGRLAVDASASYSYDDRVSDVFPIEGQRWSLGASGGIVPGTDRWWGAARAAAVGLVPLHPRHVLAGSVSVGLARGDVAHRLLALGGEGSVRAVPPDLVGTARGVVRGEYRFAPIRNASVPIAGLLWGSELQLSVGADAGTVLTSDGAASALGATAGAGVVGDWFGLDAGMMGLTVGYPLWTTGLSATEPQVYLRWSQPF
jgi:hypothetical protein